MCPALNLFQPLYEHLQWSHSNLMMIDVMTKEWQLTVDNLGPRPDLPYLTMALFQIAIVAMVELIG